MHEHNQLKHVDFDEWSKLDKELCDAYIQINRYWNGSCFRARFGKHSNKVPDGAAFFRKNLITTGSTVEYSASCRGLITEKIELELDQMICIGKIDEDDGLENLVPVTNHPGYFRLKPGSWKYVFPFFKDYQTFVCLCPLSKDGGKILKEFSDIFSLENEYVTTTKLRKINAAVTQEEIENPDNVTISGPASAAHRMINQSLVSVLKDFFPGLKIKNYNAISLNDVTKTDENSFSNVSVDLDELCFKAFPRDDENINISSLHQLIAQLKSNDMNASGMIQVCNLIQIMGYVPYADIKEFGHLYFDHVPCFHLGFWPAVASAWPTKDPRFWPNKEIVDKVISSGCHIVPKSSRGESTNEWRISFSAAEFELSHTLTQFQRKCYLVAKAAYYVVVKKIDPEVFASYFLKTVMFKLLEKQPSFFWENSSPAEVVQTLFNDLSCYFAKKMLTSFFSEDLNLLEGIENDKLRFASIESAAVAKNPLAFLP